MANIDFKDRTDTFIDECKAILCSYGATEYAVLSIGLLYAKREEELIKLILDNVRETFGLKESEY